MDFDFALLLVILTFSTGIIWLLDRVFLAGGRKRRAEALAQAGGTEAERQQRAQEAMREPVIVEYARSFFPVILIVLLFRSFIAASYQNRLRCQSASVNQDNFTQPAPSDLASYSHKHHL